MIVFYYRFTIIILQEEITREKKKYCIFKTVVSCIPSFDILINNGWIIFDPDDLIIDNEN